jgi:hypothetical protein
LNKLIQNFHESRELLYKSSRSRVKAERGYGIRKELRDKEIAVSAVELLMQEKVENAWRNTYAQRWRLVRGSNGRKFQNSMTSREIKEFGYFSKVLQEQRFAGLNPVPALAVQTPGQPHLGRMSRCAAIRRHSSLPDMELPATAAISAKSLQQNLIVTETEPEVNDIQWQKLSSWQTCNDHIVFPDTTERA